jgi:hypothetical protein
MTYGKKFGPIIGTPSENIASAKMYGRTNEMRYALRLAEVIRVDYERMTCDLAYIQGDSPNAEEVPISAAYWSRRGFLGAMPEVGAVAVLGFSASHQNRHTRPFIVGFIPNGVKTALNFDPLGPIPRDAEGLNLPQDKVVQELAGFYGPTRYKMRKIYPGDILAMSRQGAEMVLDSSVRLYDRSGMELSLRSDDGALVRTSLEEIAATAAGRSSFGRVVRNALNVPTDFLVEGSFPEDSPLFEDLVQAGLIFEDGTLVPDINGLPSVVLPDGRRHSVVTRDGVDLNQARAEAFTERRLELYETSDGLMPSNPAHGFDPDYIGPDPLPAPFITSVDGTIVGNDPYSAEGRSLYGRLLRPALFSTPNDSVGVPRLEAVENTEEGTEQSLAAAKLYRMRRPDDLGELFYAHDKEGHVFFSVPASTSKGSNLGAGRSVEGELKGSAKLVMGANRRDNESLDLRTQGGLKWNLGTLNRTKRSLDVQAEGGLSFEVRRSDANGDGARFIISGNYQLAVDGGIGIIASNGDHLEETSGKREIKAESMAIQVGSGDLNQNVLSNVNVSVQGEQTSSFGQGTSTTIVSGGESTDILLGNSDLTFSAPAQRNITFQSAGTHRISATGALTVERSATGTGTYSFNAPTGSYTVGLGAGSISLNAGAGNVNITPGAVRVAAPAISLTGSVALGNAQAVNAVVGGVPGPSPHIDFVTGLPLTGNPIVRTL